MSMVFAACSNDTIETTAAENEKLDTPLESAIPAFLKDGDKVALISPSYTTPESTIIKTEAVLKEWGFTPVVGNNVGKVNAGKFAGSVEERADDFIEALKDTSIKAILCNRGGYGTIQLVDYIDPKLIQENPKWVIGYSDITTLHAMQTKAGVDVVLCSREFTQVFDAVVKAVEKGDIKETRIDESVKRILELKAKK